MHLSKQLAWGVAGEEGALQRQLSQDAAQRPSVDSRAICQSGTCQHLHTSDALSLQTVSRIPNKKLQVPHCAIFPSQAL